MISLERFREFYGADIDEKKEGHKDYLGEGSFGIVVKAIRQNVSCIFVLQFTLLIIPLVWCTCRSQKNCLDEATPRRRRYRFRA